MITSRVSLAAAGMLTVLLAASACASPRPAQAPAQAEQHAAARYLAIAGPANQRLEADFDHGLDGKDRSNLAAASADLRDAAATERSFDRLLLRLALPPGTEAMARILVAANESRARLTDAAAAATSVRQLRVFEPRLTAANVPVEDAVRVIRIDLGLPPPESS